MFHAYNYLTQLLETDKQTLEIFKWIGNAVTYIAAASIGISLAFAEAIWPFIIYMIGNSIWIKAAYIMKDRPLLWMQVFFISINSYAIWLRA